MTGISSWTAALLLAASAGGWAQQEAIESTDGFFTGLHSGGWLLDDFDAGTALGPREIRSEKLLEGGMEAGFLWSSWIVRGSVAYASTGKIGIRSGSLSAGRRFGLPLGAILPGPAWADLAAGLLVGSLEVDEEDFGEFDPGTGFLARIAAGTEISPGIGLSAWGEYRFIEFDFEDSVAGDANAGGGSLAFGGGVMIRF